MLDWDTLRFTLEETAAMAKLQCGKRAAPSAAALHQLHARTHGWAAGLMLLLETPDATAAGDPRMEQGDQTTFDYLASEVFQRLDPAMRELLPPLAIPPAVSAVMAAELTGNPHAGQRLEELVRANCFTTRHASGHYQFHPLFRNFLLNELRRNSSACACNVAPRICWWTKTAEEAAQLFIGAALGRPVELIIQNAQGLARGRHDTLAKGCMRYPRNCATQTPGCCSPTRGCRSISVKSRAVRQATERFSDADNDISGSCSRGPASFKYYPVISLESPTASEPRALP